MTNLLALILILSGISIGLIALYALGARLFPDWFPMGGGESEELIACLDCDRLVPHSYWTSNLGRCRHCLTAMRKSNWRPDE